MDRLRFFADEHVKSAYVTILRSNGYEVSAVGRDYESGVEDDEHLERCRNERRVIITNDDDFVRLAENRPHAGVIRYEKQSHSPKKFLRAVMRIDEFFSPEEMRDHIEWLEGWL
jgi:predicted nuclease of predicted toxin-antitoxin system